MNDKVDVGVVGATGAVGRRLVELLQRHPWFRLAEVGASRDSAGRTYAEAIALDDSVPLTRTTRELKLKLTEDNWRSPVLLSALPGSIARDVEAELVGRGHLVVSNSSSYRLDPDVPLVIPEVNADHLGLVERQAERWPGTLVTNPNCSVVGLALALAPLQRTFGIRSVLVTTLQSLSGAGRSGLRAKELQDNVVPHIPGEEEKLEREPLKILGRFAGGRIEAADFRVSSQANRVPVTEGHMLSVSLKLEREATPAAVAEALASFEGMGPGKPLPSAPARPIALVEEADRPQPRLDRKRARGMTIAVGRVRRCHVLDIRFSVLVNNLVRGAAGAALLNAELCHNCGLTERAGVG